MIPVTDTHKAKIEEHAAAYQFIYKNAKDADIFIENLQNYKEDRPLRNLDKFKRRFQIWQKLLFWFRGRVCWNRC